MNNDTIKASDGSVWHVRYDYPPIPSRCEDWSATHDDYDGAPDACDNRTVSAATPGELPKLIEDWIWENGEGDEA